MQYRMMGKTGERVSILGFGMMRLPVIDKDISRIDEKKSMEMLSYALDNGVNYLDTAYPYHKEKSEGFTGKVLANGYRDKVYLADKLPSWLIKEESDLDKYLQLQLKRLGVDYIDFYLLHALNKGYWENLERLDILSWVEAKKREGLIRHIGFSFHDKLEVFKQIMAAYEWEFCQLQYNYMDIETQAGQAGVEMAIARRMGLIVMEPLRGGLLAKQPPKEMIELYQKAGYQDTPASLSLKWLWQQPDISIILSGMSSLEQVKENIKIASGNCSLSEGNQQLVKDLRVAYQNRIKVPCTKCEYCMPCPQKVAIPTIFDYYNIASMYNDREWGRKFYNQFMKEEIRADKCVECGICESKCPQQINIITELQKAHEYLKV